MSPSIEMTEGMLPSSEIQPKWTFRSRPRVGPVARAMYWREDVARLAAAHEDRAEVADQRA